MNAAYDKLCEHLTNQNVGFWSRSEDLSICTDFRGEVGTYRIFARIDADDSLFQVFGHSPVRVPPGSRPAIAEAVARINCGLKVGKFEMDCDEGELRFQAAQILPDDDLDEQTIQRLIGTTMSMLNIYLPAVLSVIYGNELPKDAVRHAEPGRYVSDENERGEALITAHLSSGCAGFAYDPAKVEDQVQFLARTLACGSKAEKSVRSMSLGASL